MSEIVLLTDPLLGKIVAAQAPLATYMSIDDDFDLALYPDGEALLIRLELDHTSRVTGSMMEIIKDFAVGNKYLEAYGRAAFVSKFEEVFDVVAKDQMSFIPFTKVVEIRQNILTLLEEYFAKLDAGAFE